MKNEKHKYWENEKGEIIEFGSKAMRCYDEAGKLQFGYMSKEGHFIVKFVLDREELFGSKEGVPFLRETLNEWEEKYYDD